MRREPIELTKQMVRTWKLPPGSNQDDDRRYDTLVSGFYLRVYASGKRSFGIDYCVKGRQKNKSLGPALPPNLDKMRERAGAIVTAARAGRDLLAEERAAQDAAAIAAHRRKTLVSLLPDYLEERREALRDRSYKEVKRYLEKAWAPLHHLYVDAIKRRDVIEVLDALAKKKGRHTADRARSALSKFFRWAIKRDLCEHNPCSGLDNYAPNGSRERVLSPAELRRVWEAATDELHGPLVRLAILTGSRKGELGGLRWDEIVQTPEGPQIELPSMRTKNKRPHIVPLAPLAWQIIEGLERRGQFVFGRWGQGPFSGWSKSEQRLYEKAGLATPWTTHDLRRTFVTLMNAEGLAEPHIIEACVNHISGTAKAGIAGTYNKAAYAVQKRAALERWADYVAGLVGAASQTGKPLQNRAGGDCVISVQS